MRRIAIYVVLSLLSWIVSADIHLPIEQGQLAELPFGQTLDGDPVSINEHKSKVMVAVYYTSWCGYCRKAMPHFKHFQQVAANAGLQVVFINHKEDRKLFRDHVRWAKDTNLVMAHDRNGKFGEAYNVESYPHIIVTDHTGKIVVVNRGWGDNSNEYYAKLLSQLLDNKKRANNPVAEQVVAPVPSKKVSMPGVEIDRNVEIEKPTLSEMAIPNPIN